MSGLASEKVTMSISIGYGSVTETFTFKQMADEMAIDMSELESKSDKELRAFVDGFHSTWWSNMVETGHNFG